MAKSFYTILKEKVLDVNHKGDDVIFDLPDWLIAAVDHLEDEKALLTWAQEYEVLHGLMHFGIQQLIIALRRVARPQVKIFKDVNKARAFLAGIENQDDWHINKSQDEFSMSMIVDKLNAQKRIDDFELKAIPKPGESQAKATVKAEQNVLIKTINAMKVAGQGDTVIKATLEPAFGKTKVALALNNINSNDD